MAVGSTASAILTDTHSRSLSRRLPWGVSCLGPKVGRSSYRSEMIEDLTRVLVMRDLHHESSDARTRQPSRFFNCGILSEGSWAANIFSPATNASLYG